MSYSGGPQLTFRPLTAGDVKAISGIHHRACLIAYAFMNWCYPLDEVERWYAGKFAEWSWTLAAFEADVMAGFIALKDHHIDQLYVDPAHHRHGIGSLLLEHAIKSVPAGSRSMCSKRMLPPVRSMRSTAFQNATAG